MDISPETGKAAADAMAYELGVPSVEGLMRNRYVGRTFIEGQNRADRARTGSEVSSGLGLSIVKAIISAHGGVVRAESEPGKGTSKIFTLPMASGAAADGAEREARLPLYTQD